MLFLLIPRTASVSPEIKHSDGPVSADGRKHVPPASGLAEGDVIDLLVVGDQLCLDVSRDHVDASQDLTRLQAPDGAGGVDARGACKRNGLK